MPESNEESEKRALKELEGKNIAHYSVLLSAWIQTKMERDKTLVTLSAAAIGLLVTILTTVGVNNIWEIPLFAMAVLAFLITIWSSLVIYQLNSQHLEDAIKGSSVKDPRLEKYDKRSIRAFIVGSVFALLIGILSASSQLTKSEESDMTDKENDSPDTSKPATLNHSLNGVNKLNPNDEISKSFDGITNLTPQATQKPSETQNQPKVQSQGDSSDQVDSGSTSSSNDKE